MYNDHNDMYDVDDFDEDIKCREALINEVKDIPVTAEWNDVYQEISNLKRRWKQIHYWESDYEDQLSDTFERYINVFYDKRREAFQSNYVLKQELIKRAKVLAESKQLNHAIEEMSELMAQWKSTGTAGRDSDQSLWEEFNAKRQSLFDRMQPYREEIQSKFSNAHEMKQHLIEQAAALKDSEDWKNTSAQYRDLMDQWKAAGNAGREYEEDLWNAFNENRQYFYERKNAYYEGLQGQYSERYEAKKVLVERAKTIADLKEYTKEHTEQMKVLTNEWKVIGSCGKEKEDELWKLFRKCMDTYFNGMRQINEQKHLQWRKKMLDARSRKQELINKQMRQIAYLKSEMVGLLGQRAIDEMMEEIKDIEAFISELQAEITDIDNTLENSDR